MTEQLPPDRKYNKVQAMFGSALLCTIFVWIPLGLIVFWMLIVATNAR